MRVLRILPAAASVVLALTLLMPASILAQTAGQELKLVYPQPDAPPEAFEHLAFERLLLQPMDGPEQAANTRAAIDYCLTHPRWRLSVQTHKYIGIA